MHKGGTGLYKSEFQRIFIPICLRVLQRHLHFYYLKNRGIVIYWIFFFKRVCEVFFFFFLQKYSGHCNPYYNGLRTHDGWIPNYLRLKFKSQSQISKYLIFGYRGLVFYRNDGQGTHSTKMSAYKSAENTKKWLKIYLPNLSAQARKFGISMKKKGFIGCP